MFTIPCMEYIEVNVKKSNLKLGQHYNNSNNQTRKDISSKCPCVRLYSKVINLPVSWK